MAECHIGLFAFGFVFYFSWNREPAFELFFKFGLSCKQSFSFSLGIQAADLSLAFGLLSPFSGLQYLLSQGFKPRFSSLFALKLAFPHSDDGPAQSLQMCLSHLITVPVPCNLGLPKFRIRLRFGCISTSLVPVPEASVHHYRDTPPWQGDVRLPRKFPVLQPESKTPGVQSPSHQNLRPGVLPANTGHTTMSLNGCELICNKANITLFWSIAQTKTPPGISSKRGLRAPDGKRLRKIFVKSAFMVRLAFQKATLREIECSRWLSQMKRRFFRDVSPHPHERPLRHLLLPWQSLRFLSIPEDYVPC